MKKHIDKRGGFISEAKICILIAAASSDLSFLVCFSSEPFLYSPLANLEWILLYSIFAESPFGNRFSFLLMCIMKYLSYKYLPKEKKKYNK